MKNRISSLDSLRGIASGLILTHHLWIIMPFLPFVFTKLPFRIFNNGRAPVILFFVLSGVVLSMPLLKKENILNTRQYLLFLLKRIVRIYIPYLFAMIFTFFLAFRTQVKGVPALSDWFNMFWHEEYFNKQYFLEHIFLIGNIHSETFNSVIWTLIHELRIALVFPLLVYLVRKNSFIYNMLLCAALSSINLINILFKLQNDNGYHITYFETAHYTSIFIIGILITKHHNELKLIYQRLNSKQKTVGLLMALMIFIYAGYRENMITEYFLALSAVILITFALFSLKFNKVIVKKPFLLLGKISYSLYLYHVPILIFLFYKLYGKVPSWLIFLFSFFISIIIAYIAYYLFESPAHKLARKLGKFKKNENHAEKHSLIN